MEFQFKARIGHIYPIRRRLGHIYPIRRIEEVYGRKGEAEGKVFKDREEGNNLGVGWFRI